MTIHRHIGFAVSILAAFVVFGADVALTQEKPVFISVRTPQELQQAVDDGIDHIIIANHMDLSTSSRARETGRLKDAVLSTSGTKSIRVRLDSEKSSLCHWC
jgi:hypothetical protein